MLERKREVDAILQVRIPVGIDDRTDMPWWECAFTAPQPTVGAVPVDQSACVAA